jgi:hypothetical protein
MVHFWFWYTMGSCHLHESRLDGQPRMLSRYFALFASSSPPHRQLPGT